MKIGSRLLSLMLISLMLTILPLPTWLSAWRPAWILLFVLYVQCYFPTFFKPLRVCLLGISLDLLLSSLMGEHAFALMLVTWFMADKAPRFVFFSMVQQMLVIGLLCVSYQFTLYLLNASFGNMMSIYQVFGTTIMSVLCWPCVVCMRTTECSDYQRS